MVVDIGKDVWMKIFQMKQEIEYAEENKRRYELYVKAIHEQWDLPIHGKFLYLDLMKTLYDKGSPFGSKEKIIVPTKRFLKLTMSNL